MIKFSDTLSTAKIIAKWVRNDEELQWLNPVMVHFSSDYSATD